MFIIGILLLLTGVLFLHTVSSQESTSFPISQNERKNFESPLFRTRLIQVLQKITKSFQIHFLKQNQITIPIPLSGEFRIFRLGQNAYTSYNTGACVHPTECPCITSGIFCGGEPTRGFDCK